MNIDNEQDQIYMDIAKSYARMSKCISQSVGCIAVNERGRVISTGVNGTVSGFDNCNSIWEEKGPEHSKWSQKYEIHAEMNMILELAVSNQSFRDLTIYTTHSPCDNCLKHLAGLNSDNRVSRIVYNEPYYKMTPEELRIQENYALKLGIILEKLNK